MKYKLRKALLFGLLLFAIAIPHHAQNTTDLDKVIDVATNYLQYSESDNKSNLENALAQATAVNRASASAVLAAYTNLSEAIQRYVLVAQPTGGKAFDMTFKMSNPELTQSNNGWSLSPTVAYNEAEIYNQTFDLYQTLSDMPTGIYSLEVTGFYRNAIYYNGIEAAANAGCYLYGNDEEELLMTLYSEPDAALFNNWVGRYANTMSDAQTAFNSGFYTDNVVRFLHGDDDLMRVGLRNKAANNGNWTCFKQFKLYYWGNSGVTGVVRKLRINCPSLGSEGTVVPGSSVSQQTPIYYSRTAVSGSSGFWYFSEVEQGKYRIQSAETNQYITWDGERIEESKRYLALTDELYGDSSLWTLNPINGNSFAIRNVKYPDELFDTRSGSNMVGTYTNGGTPSSIQIYQFYDSHGELVTSMNTRRFKLGVSELSLNGKEAFCDDVNSLFLFPIPKSAMEQGTFTCLVTPTFKEGWGNLTIDGDTVVPGETYTFNQVEGGKSYSLRVTNDMGKEAEASITFTVMPVVQIKGSFNDVYSQGSIIVNEPDSVDAASIRTRIKWRGATTKYRNKKQYAVKLYDELGVSTDASFFGLRSDNNWILDGMSIDVARMRNRVVTDIWNEYGKKPYYIESEPNALTGTRGEFVELFLNDEYVGIYCMTEKMDRKQMKLKKLNETTNTVRGQLWKSSDWSYSVFMGHHSDNSYYPGTSPVSFNNNSETWDAYEVKYPDLGDGEPIMWDDLYSAVDFVCTATDREFLEQSPNYFDMPLLLDYYILMETILSADNHGKNMYFFTYNRTKSKKISFGLWDLDSTCGRRWNSSKIGASQDYTQYITQYEHGDYNLFRRVKACNVRNFNDSVRYRYRDLRETKLHTDSILKHFTDYKELFDISGASKREVARWNNSDAGTLNFDDEMSYLTQWFNDRMNFVDDMWDIGNLPSSIENADEIADYLRVELNGKNVLVHTTRPQMIRVVTLSGQLVYSEKVEAGTSLIQSLTRGVYLVNNKKIAIP